MTTGAYRPGRSGSLAASEYWWYRARRGLFWTVFGPHVPCGSEILEIGSADGPSVDWLAELGYRVATDLDPTGLRPGDVCAAADRLPFGDATFDVLAAFDVIEHVAFEDDALSEFARVLRPGGWLLVSVPAYQWAWSQLDELAGHHRRYTRRRLVDATTRHSFEIVRATYAFAGAFPLFAADRVRARVTGAPPESPAESTLSEGTARLLLKLADWDRRWLARRNLAFGSSILMAARRSMAQ